MEENKKEIWVKPEIKELDINNTFGTGGIFGDNNSAALPGGS